MFTIKEIAASISTILVMMEAAICFYEESFNRQTYPIND